MYIFYGIVAVVLLIDLIAAIICTSSSRIREKLECEVRCHFGLKADEKVTKAQIKEYKMNKAIKEERLYTEKKLSKEEKKLHKKLAKVNAKLAKKVKKFNK